MSHLSDPSVLNVQGGLLPLAGVREAFQVYFGGPLSPTFKPKPVPYSLDQMLEI